MLLTYAADPLTCPASLWVDASPLTTVTPERYLGTRAIAGRWVAIYTTLSGMFAAI